MKTDELIFALSRDTRPVRAGNALWSLVLALAAGGAAAMLLVALFLGNPVYGSENLGVMTFGVKLAFTVSLLLLASSFLYRAARPGHDARSGVAWLAAPFAVVALLAALALVRTGEAGRSALIFGSSWKTCIVSVSLLSVPSFALLTRAFRKLAPTDLKLTGMLAGFASGGIAALVYALYCPETSPAFLFTWYGLGIVAAGMAGRAAGPLLLKW